MKRTLSGLRAPQEELTEGLVRAHALALSEALPEGPVVVGRDGRPGSKRVAGWVVDAFVCAGRQTLDLDVAPTPTVLCNIRASGAAGGVVVTASHNPQTDLGLKFADGRGRFLSAEKVQALYERADMGGFGPEGGRGRLLSAGEAGGGLVPGGGGRGLAEGGVFLSPLGGASAPGLSPSGRGRLRRRRRKSRGLKRPPPPPAKLERGVENHIGRVLQEVDAEAVRSVAPRVIVDCCNASGSVALPLLLETLGCAVERLHCEPGEDFPHPPEPLLENLSEIDSLLKGGDYDVGFATDPDADRLVTGVGGVGMLPEEMTLPAALLAWDEHHAGEWLVVNLSTSLSSERAAELTGRKVVRTPVGEPNVIDEMERLGADFGGEGNGGVIAPAVNSTRDSLLGAALILQLFAEGGRERLAAPVESYPMQKERLDVEFDPKRAEAALRESFPDCAVDTRDGVHIRGEGFWAQVRPSNTEPVVRLFAEAVDEALLERTVRKARAALQNL